MRSVFLFISFLVLFSTVQGQTEQPAQAAAELAKRQLGNEGFWKMHDLIMENPQKLEPENLMGYGKQMGLDAVKLSELLNDSQKIDALFEKDMQQAKKCGVRGTPTILINGLKLSSRTPEGYRERINQLLKK